MKTKNKISNNLKQYVKNEKERIELLTRRRVLIKDILVDLSKYCGYDKFDTINMIYRGVNNPSIYTALKIAKYFQTNVENIFQIKD